jgi:hypothetical protein
MRTKTLVLSAVLSAAAIATSVAQTVYSVNVVGYMNVTLAPGFNLVANQLNTTNNTLGSLLSSVPGGFMLYKYVPGSGYAPYLFDDVDLIWTPNGNATLNPGEGAFIKNNQTTNVTITFVGEVLTGNSTNTLVPGFQIISSTIPSPGTAVEIGIPAGGGDMIYKYAPGAGYSPYLFDDVDLIWTPSAPTINVGEAIWYKKFSAGSTPWVRTFSVN